MEWSEGRGLVPGGGNGFGLGRMKAGIQDWPGQERKGAPMSGPGQVREETEKKDGLGAKPGKGGRVLCYEGRDLMRGPATG